MDGGQVCIAKVSKAVGAAAIGYHWRLYLSAVYYTGHYHTGGPSDRDPASGRKTTAQPDAGMPSLRVSEGWVCSDVLV
jgi:hypothetical protein